MLVADDVLEAVACLVVIPGVLAEELLEGAWSDAGVDGDRLDALLGDVGELPGDAGLPHYEAVNPQGFMEFEALISASSPAIEARKHLSFQVHS